MSGWPVLDVAIGLVFVYLLLSLICTTVNEGLMTQLRSRAKFLDQGLESLLGPDGKKSLLTHPLIQSYQHKSGDSVLRRVGRSMGLKSATYDKCPSYLSGFAFARAVYDLYRKVDQNPPPPSGQEANEKPNGTGKDKPVLPGALTALLANASGPDQELVLIKQWYDDGMDRVSGWYKRHTQAWARFLALVIAIGLNADTLRITKQLWEDPTERAKVVAAAQERSKNPPKAVSANYDAEEGAVPEETSSGVGSGQNETVGTPEEALTDTERQIIGELTGWSKESQQYDSLKDDKGNVRFFQQICFGWKVFVNHWLGWLLTSIAVSLGAPFWFDTLNRFVNIRNAGRAPDEPRDKSRSSKEVQHA